MFFTKVGYVIAWLAIGLGLFGFILGFWLANIGDAALTLRYLGGKTTGRSIDQGLYTFLFGVCLGVLCEISKHIAAKADSAKREGNHTC